MSDAKVTGTIDLAPRTTPLHGPLTLNGVAVSSPNDMNIGGDASVLSDLGLTGGVTKASSGVIGSSAVLVST